MKEMIERAEKLAKSINEAHWCTDGLSFEDVVSRLILRELQEERKMAVNEACKWVDENVGTLSAIAFRKSMEE